MRMGGGCVMRVVVIMGCGRERMGVIKRGCSEKGCVKNHWGVSPVMKYVVHSFS